MVLADDQLGAALKKQATDLVSALAAYNEAESIAGVSREPLGLGKCKAVVLSATVRLLLRLKPFNELVSYEDILMRA